MELTIRQKLRNSSIQLIVGLMLVGLAARYLNNHPAERQSIKSSVTTARQKVSSLISSSRWDSITMDPQQQQQARSSLSEIISAIKSCNPQEPTASYQVLYDTLSTSSLQEFSENSSNYYEQISNAYARMQQVCWVDQTLD